MNGCASRLAMTSGASWAICVALVATNATISSTFSEVTIRFRPRFKFGLMRSFATSYIKKSSAVENDRRSFADGRDCTSSPDPNAIDCKKPIKLRSFSDLPLTAPAGSQSDARFELLADSGLRKRMELLKLGL
ncbi:MAG: hypothetical protein ACR2II_06285 [Chthoniobacterales bacterium]